MNDLHAKIKSPTLHRYITNVLTVADLHYFIIEWTTTSEATRMQERVYAQTRAHGICHFKADYSDMVCQKLQLSCILFKGSDCVKDNRCGNGTTVGKTEKLGSDEKMFSSILLTLL